MKHTPTINEVDNKSELMRHMLRTTNKFNIANRDLEIKLENKMSELIAKIDEQLRLPISKGSLQFIRSYDLKFEYNRNNRVRRLEINPYIECLDLKPERKLPQAPALKKMPVLRVGDEIEWCFYVNGYKETSSSVVIKRLDEKACMMRDGFIVDELKVKSHTGQIAGQLLSVKRADVLNGGKKTIY